MSELTNRRHRYQFVKEESHDNILRVTIRHSRHGEQVWIPKLTFRIRKCDGTGVTIGEYKRCYRLEDIDTAPNRKARLSVEFVELLKQQPERSL